VSRIELRCCGCPGMLPSGSILTRKFCNDCKNIRQKASQNRKNHSRALKRIYGRMFINLKNSYVAQHSFDLKQRS